MKALFIKITAITLVILTLFSFTITATAADYTVGWNENSTGYWWVDEDGTYPTRSWRKLGGNWYYFDKNGYWVNDNSYMQNSIKGIDVSYWQGNIDWQKVKNFGIDFAFIRLGHGINNVDKKFVQNMANAEAVGMPVGVYYYSLAQNEDEAIRDAKFVIENLQGKLVSYPVAIDLEDSSQENLTKQQLGNIAKAFCDVIAAAGYTPMLYCNEYWYSSKIDVSLIPNVEKWVARYDYKYNTDIQRNIWQSCDQGRVDGIDGKVDIDFGFTDYTKIIIPRRYAGEGKWVQNSTGWWYSYWQGGYPANEWKEIDGEKYWFNQAGYMQTGWIWDGSDYYYADSYGHLQKGWYSEGNSWYYLDPLDGKMARGWKSINYGWYYFAQSGSMVEGWLDAGSTKYFLQNGGRMAEGWQVIDNSWYYFNEGGHMATKWLYLNGTYYYLGKEGKMQTGWQFIDNNWYYFNEYGAMVKGENQYVNGNYYSFYLDGVWMGF